ncbi:MAG: response regulator [Bacteroidetes bacterium]|nr:response regulator [Bacteroidota bacterium]
MRIEHNSTNSASYLQKVKTKIKTAPLSILLADDDKDDRYFFEKALKELSIPTLINSVNDGEQLMLYLVKHAANLPDVLFLDLSMPRKNGFECLSEIKENQVLKNIPVIMFSTSYTKDFNYEKNMIETLQKIGAQDYIRKPDNFEKLKEVIKLALDRIIDNIILPHVA